MGSGAEVLFGARSANSRALTHGADHPRPRAAARRPGRPGAGGSGGPWSPAGRRRRRTVCARPAPGLLSSAKCAPCPSIAPSPRRRSHAPALPLPSSPGDGTCPEEHRRTWRAMLSRSPCRGGRVAPELSGLAGRARGGRGGRGARCSRRRSLVACLRGDEAVPATCGSPGRVGRAVPSCQLLYKPAVTPGSGGR